MKIKYLFQALKFACLPTLSILILLFCGFFSISKTIDFISSDNGWAIFLRIFLVIAEMALVIIMYLIYTEEGEKEEKRIKKDEIIKLGITIEHPNPLNAYTSIYNIKEEWSYNNSYNLYNTEDDDIVIIERKPKS